MQIKIQKILKKAKEKFSQKSQASGDSSILDSSGPTLEDVETPKTAKIFLFGRDPTQSLAKLKKIHGFIFVGDIKVSLTPLLQARPTYVCCRLQQKCNKSIKCNWTAVFEGNSNNAYYIYRNDNKNTFD